MTTQILWRDVCAMSKNLRKKLVERSSNANPSFDESHGLTQSIQPQNLSVARKKSFYVLPANSDPLVVVRSSNQDPPPGGLLLGTIKDKKGLFTKPKNLWLTQTGLLRQAVMYGCCGAGKTETLLTMALNAADPPPAPKRIVERISEQISIQAIQPTHTPPPVSPRNVFYVDGKGDNGLYAKTLSYLSARGLAGQLRVINLLTGGMSAEEIKSKGLKISHSIDLFDGFDEQLLGNWLVDMIPHRCFEQQTISKDMAQQMMRVVARLAVAFAQQQQRRITLSLLAQLMTQEGAADHAQHLKGMHGHLAGQWQHLNWGQNAIPERSIFLTYYHELLTKPFEHLDHVFEAEHPEISACRLHTPQEPPFYLLVLAPSMEKASEHFSMLPRAIITSFRMALERRLFIGHCDTMAFLDEFDYCLELNDIKALATLQNRGCGIVWSSTEHNKNLLMGEKSVFEHAHIENGTHILMKQEFYAHPKGEPVGYEYHARQQNNNPNIHIPSARTLEDFREGQAWVWNKDGSWALEMDFIAPRAIKRPFLTYVKPLSKCQYGLSSTNMTHVDIQRQTKVLSERLEQWRREEKDKAPPLSWCQETVARMLGFSNWHEAYARLGKKDA